jgi:hypothetical protein
MFIKKPKREIRFYINYCLFNTITKKDYYLILLIKKTIANIASYRIITKLNILKKKTFNKIRIITLKDKDLLTFYTLFSNYKPKVLQSSPTNNPATF